MQNLAIYFLKVVICSGLLFLYYCIALRNKQFHYYNRFYLLLITVMSLVLPLLQLHWFLVISKNDDAIAIMDVIYAAGENEASPLHASFTGMHYQSLLFGTAIIFSCFLTLRLLLRIQKIYRLKASYPVHKFENIDLVQTDLTHAPFSFLQNLFWRNDIPLNDDCGRQILRHEITHIKEKHTWDKLFMQLLLCVCWINPFYWLIQKELALVHEFIADEKAVDNKDASSFAAMLLTAQYGHKIFLPAQPFFYSPIKRRLMMLTQSKKTGYSYIRRIMALPLIAAVVTLFAFRMQKENNTTAIEKENSFTLIVDPGHGGNDGGAAANGMLEKNINLAMAKKIKSLAGNYNIQVLLTREHDITMTPAERVAWINKQKADACISIHANSSDKNSPTDNGLEICISKNNDNGLLDKSRLLGSAIFQKLISDFKITPTLIQKNTGVWILQSNPLPAALIECGYITNTADLQMITNDEKVEKMARKILEGVVLYATQKDAKPGEGYGQPYIQMDTSKTRIYGYYEGKAVKGVEVSSPREIVTLTFSDKTKKTISMGEAVKNKILIPPPPPLAPKPPVPAEKPSVIIKEIPVTLIDGVEKIEGTISINSNINLSEENKELPIFLLNGESINVNELKLSVQPADITHVNVLKGETAIVKYGDKAKNGAVEITTKTNVTLTIEPGKTPATFPGGETAWKKYLEQNATVGFMQKQGAPPGRYTIVVSFTVEEDGSIGNAAALNDPGYGTAAKAMELIKKSGNWVPATQDSRIIKSETKQQITFIVPEKS